jgi:lipopolysaccharide assembly outer membrane protein LptD (OstA)
LKDSTNLLKKPRKPGQIDAEIKYKANDSIVLMGNGTAYLHGETEINYQSINLKADFVEVKIDSSLIYARGTSNESGEKKGEPVFSEGETSYNSREIKYNLKTKKGFIRHVVTKEGEGYIISDKTKRGADNVFCISDGKYTTCENHDHPDFYLSISKGKIKPGEYIVTGPAHLVIADVPLPVALPFGFFPFTSKYSSGVLMPGYTDEMTRGFGLTNGGYYFAINDYMDMEIRGDVYTKGTWALSAATNYVKRYKFRGSLNVSYREDVTGEKGLPDYNKANNLSIQWSHNQDAKANPNFNFSASVRFSTSGYDRSNINSYYKPELNSNNTKSSSISFTKRFPSLPSLSLSGSVLVNQRTKDSTINLSLPNINIAYSRFFPFKRKNPSGKERWYEKISMSYSGNFANSIDTKESKLLTSSFTKDWRNSMRHSIPIAANFNLFKFINITPSINYNEKWLFQSVNRSWDKVAQKEIKDTTGGFYRVFDFNMNVAASTKLYAFFIPSRAIFGDKIDRIRYVMTPSIGFGYTPDFTDPFWGYYSSYNKVTTTSTPGVYNEAEYAYSRFNDVSYSKGKSGNINFSLGNNIEMKVKNEKDTTSKEAFKKISLLESLNLGGSYNLAADSMNWSMISASMRLKITKNYSLSLSTSFDPYMYGLTKSGSPVRINELRWNNGKFPRFQGTSTSYSYTFNNETFNKLFKKKEEGNESAKAGEKTAEFDEDDTNISSESRNNDGQATGSPQENSTRFSIPWSFSVNYSIRYGNSTFNKEKMEFDMEFTHNLSFNGNIALTPNWKISGNSTYDFKAKEFTYTSISINRSLHCWNMSASVVPFGAYKSYNFHLGVNASMLSDLKYDKRSEYGVNNITWY